VQVSVLGPVEVRIDGVSVDISGARLRALLARLAVEGGAAVSTAALISALWGERPPADEINALQTLVSRLRRVLGSADSVAQYAGGYRLTCAPRDIDAVVFEREASLGRRQLAAGEGRAALTTLEGALRLWRAATPVDLETVAPGLAARLVDRRLEASADRIEARFLLGEHAEAVVDAAALHEEQPLQERYAALLMTALAGSGRQAEALAVYETVRGRLADELGVDPAPELRECHLAVLRGGESRTNATRSDAAPARPRSNLPAPLTSFVGRDEDLERVQSLLAANRLVTILGPGGAGKTRLATESAALLSSRFPDGVWLVELAPLTDPAEVPQTVLSSLGQRETAMLDRRTPRQPREVIDSLIQNLSSTRCLLILDNCEHLLDAVAGLADHLLAQCPDLLVLTTSREPLGIVGETLVTLRPLGVPPVDSVLSEALTHPAVRLFADRAAAVQPGFRVDQGTLAAVVEVVRRLDGLPLAIELAAARLRTLPVAEIASRLSDRFRLLAGGSRTAMARHRTLRAVVEWSWDLLSPAEKLLAERAAVFPAGLSPASALAICVDGETVSESDVPDLLDALVEKSLLQLTGDALPRYRMLETIREYGTERLADRGELAGIRERHARYFAGLAARLDPQLRAEHQLEALAQLRLEHDNVMAALRQLADLGDVQAALELALDLGWYWIILGRHAEGAAMLASVLSEDLTRVDPQLRISARMMQALNSAAASDESGSLDRRGDNDQISQLVDDATEALTQRRPHLAVLLPMLRFFIGDAAGSARELSRLIDEGDPWIAATAHFLRARLAENEGDLEGVRKDTDAALDAFSALGDRWGMASTLPMAASLRLYDGDLDGALARLTRARELSSEFGRLDFDDALFLSIQIADVHLRRGDVPAARASLATAREVVDNIRRPEWVAVVEALSSGFERIIGDLPAARHAQQIADRVASELLEGFFGYGHGRAIVNGAGAMLDIADGNASGGAARLAVAYSAALDSRDLPLLALIGVGVATLACAAGAFEDAAEILGAAARLRGADDPTGSDIAAVAAASREALGDRRFETAYAAGRSLDRPAAQRRLDPALVKQPTDQTRRR
jgi:predicted ATPase